jgi:hypothetical protein
MMTKEQLLEAEALKQKRDKEQLLKSIQDLLSEYCERLDPIDIIGAVELAKQQFVGFHSCTAFENMNKNEKGKV